MSIKQGVPLQQTGLLDDHHLRILKALSITTAEELAGLAMVSGKEAAPLFEAQDVFQLAEQSTALAVYSVSDDMARIKDLAPTRGTGALPPTAAKAERESELFLQDVDLVPAAPSDKPTVFLDSCFGPVRNQGRRGTCVAHAVVAVLECLEAQRTGAVLDLSEQFLYWECKMNDGDPNKSGTWQRVAVPLTVEFGVCEEKIWPYVPDPIAKNESQGPPPDRDAAFNAAERHRPNQGIVLDGSELDRLRARLDSGHCLAISIPVYQNWETPTVEREGHIPMPIPGQMRKGGHAMSIVGYGYSDEFLGGGYVIVRNSWGADWAYESPFAPGYGTLPFSYVTRYWWELFSLD